MRESRECVVEALPCPCSPSTHGECTAAGVSNMQESSGHTECALQERIVENVTLPQVPHCRNMIQKQARTGMVGVFSMPPPSPVHFPIQTSQTDLDWLARKTEVIDA